jgi:hypothetical protein
MKHAPSDPLAMSRPRLLAVVPTDAAGAAYASSVHAVAWQLAYGATMAAEEKNAENLLVIRGDGALEKKYLANFKEHLEHSEKYEGRN